MSASLLVQAKAIGADRGAEHNAWAAAFAVINFNLDMGRREPALVLLAGFSLAIIQVITLVFLQSKVFFNENDKHHNRSRDDA